MVAEIYPRMTSLIKNSKWRRDLLKGCIREGGEEGAGSGRKGENYATLSNILQSKKYKEAGGNKYRAGTGIKRYGKRKV